MTQTETNKMISAKPDTVNLSMDMLETPVCRFFPDMTIAYVNDFFCNAFKHDCQEFTGRPLLDHVPPSFHSAVDAISALTPEQPTATLRFPIVDGAGIQCWSVWSCKGDFKDDQSLGLVTAFARVISEDLRHRTALEQLLQIANDPELEYDARVRGILACGMDYLRTDTAGIIGFSERGQLELGKLGLGELTLERKQDDQCRAAAHLPPKDELKRLLSVNPTIAIHDIPATIAKRNSDYRNLSSGGILACEIYQDGALTAAVVFTLHAPSARPYSDENIQFCQLVAQWLAYLLEQHRFLAELQHRELKYRHLFENAPVMMHIVDADNRILETNKCWLNNLGYARDEIIGQPIENFIAPAIDSAHQADEYRIAQSYNFVAKDGSIIEAQISTPGPDLPGAPRLAVMINVTERNRALQGLTDNRKTLMQANDGLKRFNTIAAHDLQEPLRKIRLFGGLLKDALDTNADPEVETAIEKIIDAANRLTTLVKDLLLYSREGERVYVRQKVNLTPLLDEVFNDLALLIEETDARIKIYDLPEIQGDAIPLQRLFANLILNALKYRHEDRIPEIEIFSRQTEDEETEIVVRDNGIGLREGEETAIFAPFVRARPQLTTGSGIGLALCQSIVDGHGWTIRAENREAGGSDFIINLGLFS